MRLFRPMPYVRCLIVTLVTASGLYLTASPVSGPSPSAGAAATNAPAAAQWQLPALRLPEAWRITRGEGVLVAVLDTGVNGDHPDLAGSVVAGPDLTGAGRRPGRWGHHGTAMASLIAGHGHTDPATPPHPRDPVDAAAPPHPRNPPGAAAPRTGPAGRAAALGVPVRVPHAARETARLGVIGVAPGARILSVRVTLENDDPLRARPSAGRPDALARGIRYAADHGADVISMSLGGGSGAWNGSPAEKEAVRYALSRGAVLVASSGNDGETTNRKNYPAAYPGVIAVGAVDRRLKVAAFSNRQDYLSVVAPGTGILTADGDRSYVVGDGTSAAAAMVAGIAALVRSAYPGLPPRQVRAAIERGTASPPSWRPWSASGADGRDRSYGHGVADALFALREAGRLTGARAGTAPPAPPGRPARADGGAPDSRLPTLLGLLALCLAMGAHVLARRRAP
ncbi:S8 family peptidase [Nonomuraea roseoviolacea]|uniref:Subtilisin family serine protease n=1 Tax=Nonomuraea roseoviolacea subsp. carminata TaxID=160689 RepID=A0ABT1K1X1_9ACTN|nr:S8 family serine peptidase [Nonomuraea roseoviolacea]MCP2347993.1 subtilisin family serine protease [Nonomuraea roseoviolacea subsp. carminata]